MFDKVAPRYDLVNTALSLGMDVGWRRQLVSSATDEGRSFDVKAGDRVRILDVATGTAEVAILLGREASYAARRSGGSVKGGPPTAEILGVDPSSNMIEYGRKKISAESLDDVITLTVGDARNMKDLVDTGAYDVATMSFGIRNVPERERALCEIRRALKSDGMGTLAVLEFSEPTYERDGALGLVAAVFIRRVVPLLGALLSGRPREYLHLQNSIKEFPTPSGFKAEIEGVRCEIGKRKEGRFEVREVRGMNFGSVHLYLAKTK